MHTNQKSFLGLMVAAATAALSCSAPGSALARGTLRDQRSGYDVDVLVDGRLLPTFHHAGESYVMGGIGERYVLRVHNRTGARVEAVVSVDGLDVIDGQPASFGKRGYLVPAWGYVDIDGWRMSNRQVAAFRFSSVRESYAAKTGKARNVGVIGVAMFPERARPRPQPIRPYPPHSHDQWRDDGGGYDELSARRKEAPARSSAPSAEDSKSSADASAGAMRSPSPRERSGLGTEFGERHHSQVHEVAFVRAHASQPASVLGLHYNDREGLYAMGIDVDGHDTWSEVQLRRTASPFPSSTRRFARPPGDWDGR